MSGNRVKARQAVMQALYQWQMNPTNPRAIETQFLEDEHFQEADPQYFQQILRGVFENLDTIDEAIQAQVRDRKWSDLSEVERAILRMAGYELMARPDVPYRVVINEALELAKGFGSDQGHRFVNGVLDKLAQQWRSTEISRKGR